MPGMLVLSRQRDEEIVIGDDVIRISVVSIRGDKVRLGVCAPKGLSVHRREVFDAIKLELANTPAAPPEVIVGMKPPISIPTLPNLPRDGYAPRPT